MIHTVKVLTTGGQFEFDVADEEFLAKVLEYLQDAVNGTATAPTLTFGQFPEVWSCRTSAILGVVVRKRDDSKQRQWDLYLKKTMQMTDSVVKDLDQGDEWKQ